MSEWRKRISEEAGPEHARKVFEKAEEFLAANERLEREEAAARPRTRWHLWLPVPALALSALAIVVLHGNPPQQGTPATPVATNSAPEELDELELAMDFDVILNVHEVEQFRLMKELGKPEQWKRKEKPKKTG